MDNDEELTPPRTLSREWWRREWGGWKGTWRRRWKPRLRGWWWQRGKFLVALVLLLVGSGVLVENGWLVPVSPEQLADLLPVLLTAGVFLVSVPGAYLVSRHFEFRGEQAERREKYWNLQAEYRQYAIAFWELERALSRHYGVEIQGGRDYEQFRMSLDFWKPDTRAMASAFVRDLWEAAQEHWKIARPQVRERTIGPAFLDHLYDVMGRLTSVWARSKYYRPLLGQLGVPLPAGEDVRSHRIVPSNWQHRFENFQIVRQSPGDPATAGFWEDRFDEALDILDRMRTHGLYLFGGPPRIIRAMLGELAFLTLVAVVVPMALLAYSFSPWIEAVSTYFSVLGFFAALFLVGATLYHEVLESSVLQDRRAPRDRHSG